MVARIKIHVGTSVFNRIARIINFSTHKKSNFFFLRFVAFFGAWNFYDFSQQEKAKNGFHSEEQQQNKNESRTQILSEIISISFSELNSKKTSCWVPLKDVIFHLFCLTDRVSNISNHFTFHAISILDMLESRACVANIPAKRIESILPAKIESKRYKCTKLLKTHAKLYPSEWHIANRREERKKRPWQNYSHTLKHDISYIKVRFVGCFSLIKKI